MVSDIRLRARTGIRAAIWALATFCPVVTTAAAQQQLAESPATPDPDGPAEPDNPLQREGTLQKLAIPIRELVGIQWDQGQLELRLKEDAQEVNSVVDRIREITGYGGGSSHYGGGTFRFDLGNDQITGYVAREGGQRGEFLTSILIQEETAPNRTLAIEKSSNGRIKITINDSQSGYLLRVRQQPGGQFGVQELRGTDVFSGVANDFDSFCHQYREYVLKRLIPALQHFGVGLLQTPYSPEVQQAIVSCLRPWQDDELQRVEDLTRGLDAASFADRQAASELLKSRCQQHLALLIRVTRDNRFSPETRTRIRALIREGMAPEEMLEMDFIDNLLANLDAAYVRELVQMQTDAESRDVLTGHLRRLTGRDDLTADGPAQLVVSQSADTRTGDGPPPVEPDLLSEQGPLQEVAGHTAGLVHLIWHNDQLAIDRDHWAQSFDGRPVAELIAQVEQSVGDTQLPAHWFQAGGDFDPASVQYPQILFEKLEEASGPADPNVHRARYIYYGRGQQKKGSPNRQFELKNLAGRMQFVAENRRQPAKAVESLDDKPFRFSLTEKTEPLRSLVIDETRPGELKILVTGDTSNFILQLILSKDSALVQDIRGTRITALQADTFRQLLEQHPEYFERSLFPLLRYLGISVDAGVMADDESRETTIRDMPRRRPVRVCRISGHSISPETIDVLTGKPARTAPRGLDRGSRSFAVCRLDSRRPSPFGR